MKQACLLIFLILPSFLMGYCQSNGPSQNLIPNGNFNKGNTGFFSSYKFTASNTTEGEYYIGTAPSNWYHLHYPCGDHSTGYGSMLLVNGAPEPNQVVWETTVQVKEKTDYLFSLWITSISRPNPGMMALMINGKQVGSLIKANSNTCDWQQFSAAWSSDIQKTAKISIVNKNTVRYGNDFALDDLLFVEQQAKPTTVDCSLKIPARFKFTVSQCSRVSFLLNTANISGLSKITWNFGDGSKSSKKSPVHFYKKPGAYTVSAITTSKNGCLDTFSRQVNIKFLKTDFVVSEEDAPGEILFKAKANGPRYTWNLGDSSVINNETIVRHTYRSSGEYTAMLFAENNSGCKDTVVHQLRIDLPPNDLPDAPLQQYEVTQVAEDAVQPIIENRETDIVRSLDINEDSVQIAIYDNGVIDGDSITLIYDGMIILSRQVLKREPLLLKLAVGSMQETHLLKMYAENLGTIPPNTALMVIRDGENRHDIYVSSNATSNGSVLFRRRR